MAGKKKNNKAKEKPVKGEGKPAGGASSPSRRFSRYVFFGLVFFLAVVFAFPSLFLKSMVEKEMSSALGLKVGIRSISYTWGKDLVAYGLTLKNADGADLGGIQTLAVKLNRHPVFGFGGLHPAELQISKANLLFKHDGKGWNWDLRLEQEAKADSTSSFPNLIKAKDGSFRVEWVDDSGAAVSQELDNFQLELRREGDHCDIHQCGLRWGEGNVSFGGSFSSKTGAASIKWKTENLDLKKNLAGLPDMGALLKTPLESALSGALDASVQIGSAGYDWDKTIMIGDISVSDRKGNEWAQVPEIGITLQSNPLTENEWDGGISVRVGELRLVKPVILWTQDMKESYEGAKEKGKARGNPELLPLGILVKDGTLDLKVVDADGSVIQQNIKGIHLNIRRNGEQFVLEKASGVWAEGGLFLEGWFNIFQGTRSLLIKGKNQNLAKILEGTPDGGKSIGGKLDMELSFRQPEAGTAFKADGRLHLKESKLWDMALFTSVFSELSMGQANKLGVVDEAFVEFDYDGNRTRIPEARFMSQSLSLFGFGNIDREGRLDLEFVPRIGKKSLLDFVPIIGGITQDVLDKIKGNLIKVKVTGTLFKPESRVESLGDLKSLGKNLTDFLK